MNIVKTRITSKHLNYPILNQREKIEVFNSVGYPALYLYEYYLFKANVEGFNFDDLEVSREMGMEVKSVTQNRHKLQEMGYLFQTNAITDEGLEFNITFLGRDSMPLDLIIKKVLDLPNIESVREMYYTESDKETVHGELSRYLHESTWLIYKIMGIIYPTIQ